MPDDRDYSADRPRRDRSREPIDSSRGDEWDDSLVRRDVPKLVRTAGIIWIVFGALICINAVVNLGIAGAGGSNAGSGACSILFGVAFIFVGWQSLKGTAKDTLGNGIGSIVIGILNTGIGALVFIGGLALSAGVVPAQAGGQPLPNQAALLITIIGGISIVCGLGLILAGVLALMGRAEYKAYRQAGKRSAPNDD